MKGEGGEGKGGGVGGKEEKEMGLWGWEEKGSVERQRLLTRW